MIPAIVPAAAATPLPDAAAAVAAVPEDGAPFDLTLEASLQGAAPTPVEEAPMRRFIDPLALAEWMLVGAPAPQADAAVAPAVPDESTREAEGDAWWDIPEDALLATPAPAQDLPLRQPEPAAAADIDLVITVQPAAGEAPRDLPLANAQAGSVQENLAAAPAVDRFRTPTTAAGDAGAGARHQPDEAPEVRAKVTTEAARTVEQGAVTLQPEAEKPQFRVKVEATAAPTRDHGVSRPQPEGRAARAVAVNAEAAVSLVAEQPAAAAPAPAGQPAPDATAGSTQAVPSQGPAAAASRTAAPAPPAAAPAAAPATPAPATPAPATPAPAAASPRDLEPVNVGVEADAARVPERGSGNAGVAATRMADLPRGGQHFQGPASGSDSENGEGDGRRFPAAARLAAALSGAAAPAAADRSPASPLFSVPAAAAAAAPAGPAAVVAPAPAAAFTVPDAENITNLVEAMRVTAKNGGWEATVRLRPEHLGEVTIALRVDGNSVSALVNAEAPGVRQWLMAQEEAVRAGMAEHGLQLERFQVDRDGQRREAEEQQEQPRRRQARRPQATPERFEIVV